MALFEELIDSVPAGGSQGEVEQVLVGLHWTVVSIRTVNGLACGLAATQSGCCTGGVHSPSVRSAGQMTALSPRELASLVFSNSPTEVSIGLAAINALLPRPSGDLPQLNAEEYILTHGLGRKVVIVGHFPFVEAVRAKLGQLWVLELDPGEGDLPASQAGDLIPQADLVAITASTLSNGTFEGLMSLCRPETRVLLLGPSTPLSPVLFRHGVHVLSGTIVEIPEKVFPAVGQGANFQQIRKAGGVRLVTLTREEI
jgi:uncharacterized protein (DUF4213/DUF364 family)